LDAVAKYQGKSQAKQWTSWFLNPQQSMLTTDTIRMNAVPLEGFSDEAHFQRWWQTHQEHLELVMNALTKPPAQ
jgi:hypothetical protein